MLLSTIFNAHLWIQLRFLILRLIETANSRLSKNKRKKLCLLLYAHLKEFIGFSGYIVDILQNVIFLIIYSECDVRFCLYLPVWKMCKIFHINTIKCVPIALSNDNYDPQRKYLNSFGGSQCHLQMVGHHWEWYKY